MAFGYAAALAPIDLHSLYVAVVVLLPFIIVCKAFLNSAPLKDILMFQTGSPLGVLLDADELLLEEDDEEEVVVEEVVEEVLLLVVEDSSEFEEITLLVLSSIFDELVIVVLVVRGLLQPDKIKAVAARIKNRFFFFIALLLYLYT